jgi:choline dehydrogenase-like flavoprotein
MVSNRGPFFDSRQIPAGTEIDCDVCIIGAGVAGITIAQELINEQLKVIVLESGGEDYDETTEDLGRLVVSGRPYPPEGSRLRFLGGTSNHWGGHCVPLRSHVFEKRAWMDNASWPFSINELHPFYARAHQILGIGPYSYDPAAIAQKLNMPILPFRPTQIETVLSRYHRMNFRDRYRTLLDKAKNIDVFLYATVSSL